MNDIQPFNSAMPVPQNPGSMAMVAREVQEAQGMIVSAKMYPRDQGSALKRIEGSCERIKLAERAMYSYPRGGQTVTGPSIRMAEVIAQFWGNLDTGWKVVGRRIDETDVVAWAWDLETNTRKRIEFTVPHLRETKNAVKILTDSRDIYEMVANQASRRQRNCILAVVPSDIVDAAIERCEKTLLNAGSTKERQAKMVAAFKEMEVTEEQLERRFGKKISAMTATDVVQAQKIYQSLRDGMSKNEDWFEAIHEPEKIKKEAAAAAKEPVSPNAMEKAKTLAEKDKAIAEFQQAYQDMRALGGEPDIYLGKGTEQVLRESAPIINALTDKLSRWIKEAKAKG